MKPAFSRRFRHDKSRSAGHLRQFATSINTHSSCREIRGRIADQANKLISHFYGLGAYLSASNFPGAAQYQSGKTIQALAAVGKFRHAQISVTTAVAPVAAGVGAGYAVSIVKSPGAGYHYTVQVPFPLPLDLAVALSAVFRQRPNPAHFLAP